MVKTQDKCSICGDKALEGKEKCKKHVHKDVQAQEKYHNR